MLMMMLAVCGEAEEITYFGYDSNGNDITYRVSDRSYTTFVNVPESGKLTLEADGEAGYLYVKFRGAAPENGYTVTALDSHGMAEVINAGENGYLHDLVKLTDGTKTVEITCDEAFAVTELYIYTPGELSDSVQRWENTLDECDVLILSAHSDDDTLFFGALAAENVAKQRLVQTAFMTDHAGELHRRNELLDGQWTLGIKAYPIIDNTPDIYSMSLEHARNAFRGYDILGFIVESIRRTKPAVVVTHDFMGEYGHGAHRLMAALTVESLELTGDNGAYPESAEAYGVHMPKKVYIHHYEENKIILDVDAVYDTLGGRSPFEVATAAYDCHVSQHKWYFEVTKEGTDDCRPFGLYYADGEYDVTSNDIMSGITPISPTVSETAEVNEEIGMQTAVSSSEQYQTENVKASTVPDGALIICMVMAALVLIYVLAVLIKRITRKN